MLAAFFMGVLACALLLGGAELLQEGAERRRIVQAARWRHRRGVFVRRWPDCGFADL